MFGGVAELTGIRPAFALVALVAAALAAGVALVAAPGREQPRRARSARALRDRGFVGGLWLNTLPALFFGTLDVLVPLRLDDAGYGALAIAAVFVAAGLIEVGVNPLVGRVSDRARASLADPGLARRVDRRLGRDRVRDRAARRRSARGRRVDQLRWLLHAGHGPCRGSRRAAGLAQGIGFGVMNSAWAAGALVGPAVGGALAEAFGDPVPYLSAGRSARTLVAVTRGAARLRAA